VTELAVWPDALPERLAGLPARVGDILDASPRLASGLSELGLADPALVVLTEPELAPAAVLEELDRIVSARTAPTVLLIGDGWIGTDGPDVSRAVLGAAAVALARSVAVRRTPTGRVNVVCVPERLVGEAGSQRGPLALDIADADIAEVVAFALGTESAYIDGQVLYANGGRHLFSSLTA
jgi:hypothetical protein